MKNPPFEKTKPGSVLVFSIIILSIMLVTSLTILSSALLNQKASLSTGGSTRSFQVADSGVEEVLYQIYKNASAHNNLGELAAAVGGSCISHGVIKLPVAGGEAKVIFYQDETTVYNVACGTDDDWRDKVVKIKSEGTAGSTTRAVEVAVAQKNTVFKPTGMASSGGGSPSTSQVLIRDEVRQVLIGTISWESVETSRGTYDFSAIDSQISNITNAGKFYSLAVPAGPHAPSWLKNADTTNDGIESDWIREVYTNPNNGNTVDDRIPLPWDNTAKAELQKLANALGAEYNSDPNLKLVYVGQFSQNGNEGQLPRDASLKGPCRHGGVIYSNDNDCSWSDVGYSDTTYVDAALDIIGYYVAAFPDKAIAIELHDVNGSADVPRDIINGIESNPALRGRVGVALWWLSGKTDYQPDLLSAMTDFSTNGGDVYAQLIGKSDQPTRFLGNDFTSVFDQAKDIGVRYIEPWEFEYKISGSWPTYQSDFDDFNIWADANF